MSDETRKEKLKVIYVEAGKRASVIEIENSLKAMQSLSIADLEQVTIGMVYDMITEKSYDENGYIRRATQKDFDRF